MAETPSHQSPASAQMRSDTVSDSDPLQYWCYHCDKRVSIETLADLPDVICHECKNGFVESISATALPPSRTSDQIDEASLGGQFLQVIRLIAQVARDENAPHPPPSELADPSEDDYLRIELNRWDNDDDDNGNDDDGVRDEGEEGNERGFRIRLDGWDNDDGDDDDDDDDEANDVEVRNGEQENEGDRSDDQNDENENREYEEEEVIRRRRDILRLQLRDFASRRNRILDWAEILMGLEDHSIELRLQVPEMDGYVGNPEDYVDAAGYEALLQNLAESDGGGGRRGAPPAAKSAILALPSVEIKSKEEAFVCAVCKDSVNVGELVKKLPCGHGYHGDCIVPWLGSRNSCPVCRFELPTDDPDYEEDRKKRTTSGVASSSGLAM